MQKYELQKITILGKRFLIRERLDIHYLIKPEDVWKILCDYSSFIRRLSVLLSTDEGKG